MFGAQRRSAFEQRTGKLGDREPSFEVSVPIQLVLFNYSAFRHKRGLYENRYDQTLAMRITCIQILLTGGLTGCLGLYYYVFTVILSCTSVKYGGFQPQSCRLLFTT